MGGSNSGRHGGKGTTQGRNTMDVRKWQRDGVLIPGSRFTSSWTCNGQPSGSIGVIVNTGSVNLIYRHGGDTGQDMNYPGSPGSTLIPPRIKVLPEVFTKRVLRGAKER